MKGQPIAFTGVFIYVFGQLSSSLSTPSASKSGRRSGAVVAITGTVAGLVIFAADFDVLGVVVSNAIDV